MQQCAGSTKYLASSWLSKRLNHDRERETRVLGELGRRRQRVHSAAHEAWVAVALIDRDEVSVGRRRNVVHTSLEANETLLVRALYEHRG